MESQREDAHRQRDETFANALRVVFGENVLCEDTYNSIYNRCVSEKLPLSLAVCVENEIGGSADCEGPDPDDEWVTEELFMACENVKYYPYDVEGTYAVQFVQTLCTRRWWRCMEDMVRKRSCPKTISIVLEQIEKWPDCPARVRQLAVLTLKEELDKKQKEKQKKETEEAARREALRQKKLARK